MKTRIALTLTALLAVACASTNKTDSASSQAAEKTTAAAPATPTTTAPATSSEVATNPLAAELAALQKESTYFDYKRFDVKPAFQAAVRKQADFIKQHKDDVVTLEGNCDERGSDKYNMTLGDKRANAVRSSLLALGVPAKQIKTVSLGKSQPRLSCHEEKCWQENRRVDFVHSVK